MSESKPEKNDVVIIAARRTPIGKFMGAFADTKAVELAAAVIKAALEDAGINADEVDETFLGCVVQAGMGQNPARQAILKAGASEERGSAVTLGKVCGSGLYSVIAASRAIRAGDINTAIAGGMEVMSQIPYYLNLRKECRFGHTLALDGMLIDGLLDFQTGNHMGIFAENIAKKYNISREDQDRFAVRSYDRALRAIEKGKFSREIVPVEVTSKKTKTIVEKDENPVRTSYETALAAKGAFLTHGSVTAINASKLADGASVLVLMSAGEARKRGLEPLAAIRSATCDTVPVSELLISPVHSIPRAVKIAGLELEQIDLFEINEAFSASSVAIERLLGLKSEKVNIYGGAVALGHPVGASGARILTTLLSALHQEEKHFGVASLCIGGGEAVSVVVEKLE